MSNSEQAFEVNARSTQTRLGSRQSVSHKLKARGVGFTVLEEEVWPWQRED